MSSSSLAIVLSFSRDVCKLRSDQLASKATDRQLPNPITKLSSHGHYIWI